MFLHVIKLTGFHTQEFVDGNPCAQGRDDNSENEYRTIHNQDNGRGNDCQQVRLITDEEIAHAGQQCICQDGCKDTYPDVLPQERTSDERPARSYQFHGVYQEAFGVNGQPDSVVDECEGYQRQQSGQSQ